ncbi:type I restriction enzyme S subunit [Arthrobacter sp. TE12231]
MTTTETLGGLIHEYGGSIKTGPFGTALKANEYSKTGVPIISVGEVGYGSLSLRRDTPCAPAEVTERLPEYLLETGDIVFGRKGAVDRSAWVKRSEEGWFLGSDGIRVRLPSTVDSRYVGYQFQSEATKAWLLQHASGSTMLSLNQKILERVPLQLPPLDQQRAIAEVLGALDDKIAANTKLADRAGGLADLIYDRSAEQFETRPMSDVLSPVLGGTPPRSRPDFWDGDRLWASAKDITGAEFGVVTDTAEKITEVAVEGTKARPLPKGSVILTARGTVGTVARLAVPASFNQSCYGFVPGDVPPGVLYFAVLRATLRAKEIAHGSVFDTITMKTFNHLDFPDFDSEAMLATEAEVGPLLNTVVAAVVENASLGRLRDALLPQLMSGKLRVKDAEKVLEDAGV